MKARDWLIQNNLAKPGRGKFSNVAHEALRKAISEGKSFSDYPKGEAVVKATGEAVAIARVSPEDSVYVFPSDFRFPESDYVAKSVDTGKVYSVREVCNNCGVSLTNHACDEPTIYGNVEVQLVAR